MLKLHWQIVDKKRYNPYVGFSKNLSNRLALIPTMKIFGTLLFDDLKKADENSKVPFAMFFENN